MLYLLGLVALVKGAAVKECSSLTADGEAACNAGTLEKGGKCQFGFPACDETAAKTCQPACNFKGMKCVEKKPTWDPALCDADATCFFNIMGSLSKDDHTLGKLQDVPSVFNAAFWTDKDTPKTDVANAFGSCATRILDKDSKAQPNLGELCLCAKGDAGASGFGFVGTENNKAGVPGACVCTGMLGLSFDYYGAPENCEGDDCCAGDVLEQAFQVVKVNKMDEAAACMDDSDVTSGDVVAMGVQAYCDTPTRLTLVEYGTADCATPTPELPTTTWLSAAKSNHKCHDAELMIDGKKTAVGFKAMYGSCDAFTPAPTAELVPVVEDCGTITVEADCPKSRMKTGPNCVWVAKTTCGPGLTKAVCASECKANINCANDKVLTKVPQCENSENCYLAVVDQVAQSVDEVITDFTNNFFTKGVKNKLMPAERATCENRVSGKAPGGKLCTMWSSDEGIGGMGYWSYEHSKCDATDAMAVVFNLFSDKDCKTAVQGKELSVVPKDTCLDMMDPTAAEDKQKESEKTTCLGGNKLSYMAYKGTVACSNEPTTNIKEQADASCVATGQTEKWSKASFTACSGDPPTAKPSDDGSDVAALGMGFSLFASIVALLF